MKNPCYKCERRADNVATFYEIGRQERLLSKQAKKNLKVGKTYTVVNVDVHSWHTEVELEEFPNIMFNSVCFDEIGGDTE